LNRWLLPLAIIVIWILCWVIYFIRVTHWMEFASLYVFLILILSFVQVLKEQHSKPTGIWISAQVDIRERHSLPVRVILAVILCFFSTIIFLIALSDVSLSWLIWNMLAAITTAFTIFLTQDETEKQNQIFHEPSN
jgi:hypothetical protein